MSSEINIEELHNRFKKLFSGLINDSLRELNYLNQALPPSISPLRDEMKIAGPAFTVLSIKERTKDFSSVNIKSKMEYRARILDSIYSQSVVIWDTNNDNECAQWGAMMTKAAKRKGCCGAVIDGGVRDTKDVLKQDFSIFNRYRTSNGVLGRHRWLDYQVPISIGDVIIKPGDYVFGDIDGVVIIPKKLIYKVLDVAERKKREEEDTENLIDNGLTAEEIAQKGGIF